MDLFLIIIAGLLLLTGFIGAIVPILPGIPLSYLGIILLHLSSIVQFSSGFLIILGVAVVVVQLLDFIIPVWGTKKTGGSKAGVRGSVIGLMVGFFMGPWGIITGPSLVHSSVNYLWVKHRRKQLRQPLEPFWVC